MVIRRADVGNRDPGLHPLPRHVRQRGDEEGQGGRQAGEARALRQVSCKWGERRAVTIHITTTIGLLSIVGFNFVLLLREIYNMMFYCWDNDPQERPSFQQLVKVNFIEF